MNNNIITPEQAGGKQGVWGTTEQLLINKTIVNDAKQKRRNLITVWLDYKKAFDSIPHTWLIKALHDCNRIRTHNHLIRKRTLNHLAKLAK